MERGASATHVSSVKFVCGFKKVFTLCSLRARAAPSQSLSQQQETIVYSLFYKKKSNVITGHSDCAIQYVTPQA